MSEGGEFAGATPPSDETEPVLRERYRTLVDAVDDGLIQFDAEARIVDVNDAAVETLEADREELVGNRATALCDAVDVERVEGRIEQLRDGDDAATLELPVRTADGDAAIRELRLTPVEHDGEFHGGVGVLQDGQDGSGVRENERTDSGVRENERRFELLVDGVEEYAIFMLDPEGRVATWNSGAERIKGYAEDEIVGEHFSTFYTDEDREAGAPAANLDAAMADGWVEDEGWRVRADGTRFWANVTITAISGDDGTLQGFAKVTRDMTDRRRRERELRREREQTAKLLQTAPVSITVRDADGDTVLANRRAQDFLGLGENELLEMLDGTDEWVVHDADGDPLSIDELPVRRVLDGGDPVFDEEIAIDRRDGERRWFRVNAAPIVDSEGDVERVISAAEDVTELKRREREARRQKDELETELSEIFGRVSDAFFGLDREFRFTHLNDRAHDLINPDDRELVGERIWDAFPEAAERKFKTQYGRAMEEQETVSFEEYYPAPIDRWFEVRAYPSETGISVYFRDVTERKERERELQRKERRFEAVFEDPHILVGLLEPDGTVLDINGTAMEYVDADLEAVTGEPFWETPWWGEGDGVRADVREWTQRAAAGEYVDFEADLTRPDGQRYTLEGVFRPVTNDDGDVVSIIVSDRDITERKEREEELRERERQLSTLMDNVPGMVYRCRNDRGWPIEFVSEACRDITGYDPADLEEGTISYGEDIIVEADRDEVWEEVQRGLDERGQFSVTYRIETADGDRRWVRSHGRGVYDDDGNLVDLEGIVSDVTERKRLENELRESERRHRTLAEYFPNGIVTLFDHDLRYTLAAGQGFDSIPVDPDDLEGRTFREAWDDDTAETLEPAFLAALDGRERSIELEYAGREWVFEAVPITDEEGDVFAGMTMARDITERKERERQVAESERKYRTLVENFPNGAVGLFDEDLRYTVTGGQAFDDLDVSRDAVVGKTVSERYSDDLAATIEPRFRAALEGESSEFEFRNHGRDIRAHTVPVEDDDGDVSAGMIMAQDVTERKEQERELEQYKEYLDSVLDGIDDLFYVLDSDGDLRRWNESVREVSGYSDAELASMSVHDFFDGDDVATVIENGFESGTVRVEADLRTSDGETVPYEFSAVTVENPAGETVLAGIGRDISEQKARERELTKYETIVETIDDGIYVKDEEGRFTMVNGAYAEMTGYDREELVGEHASLVVDEETIQQSKAKLSERDDGAEPAMEAALRTADGGTVPTEGTFATLENAAGRQEEVGVVRDITERKERRRKLAKSEQRYRTLVENVPNGAVALVDEDLEYMTVGGDPADRRNSAPEDLEGKSVREALTPELADLLEPRYRAALDGEACTCEYEHGDHYSRFHVVPVRDADGEVFAAMGMSQDLTEQKRRERALERSERRYRTLVENFPNGAVALFDEDLQYTVVGGALFDDVEMSDEEPLGTSIRERFSGEDLSRLEPRYRAALEGTASEFKFQNHDRDLLVHTLPVEDADGEVFAGMVMVQDITEQKERERYFRDAKAQLEAAAEAGAVGTWEWHIPEDRFVAGASLARTFGVDPDAAREGVSIDRLIESIHEDDRERVEAQIEAAVEDCSEYESEYRVWDDDGELRWVVARGHVETDEDGNPVTFPGAITDITKRKRAEQRIREQRKQLETLFEVLPVGVVVADEDGRFVEANEKAKEIWGGDVFDADTVSQYEKYPARWADTGDPVDPEEYTMSKVLDGEEVTDDDVYEIETADGRQRVVASNGMPVRDDDGAVRRGVVTLADITERREYRRKLEASNERLEQFAYAASHDLQEPLRMVSSYLSLVERRYADELDEDGREFIEFAVDGADRMRDMIEALLEYSRVETRGDPFESVDLDAVYEDALRDLEMKIAESDADVAAESLPRVRGDGEQLRQVFQNLLSNAIEYSGDEPPRVRVGAERDGSRWVVSVRDDGIGIDPEHADSVFEVFNRLHNQNEHPGTGIGLALCRRIVERHGGRIWVESEPGDGSTFYFTLPAEGEHND